MSVCCTSLHPVSLSPPILCTQTASSIPHDLLDIFNTWPESVTTRTAAMSLTGTVPSTKKSTHVLEDPQPSNASPGSSEVDLPRDQLAEGSIRLRLDRDRHAMEPFLRSKPYLLAPGVIPTAISTEITLYRALSNVSCSHRFVRTTFRRK